MKRDLTAAIRAIELAMIVAKANHSERYNDLEYGLTLLQNIESSGTGLSHFANDGEKVSLKPTPEIECEGSRELAMMEKEGWV
jgi:hypothetical protein